MAGKPGKRYAESRSKVPPGATSIPEAIKILQSLQRTKFDSTVELVMSLGIDPKQPDQSLRGSLSLPHGIGASRKVIAFCDGEDVQKAKAAGAVEAGGDELIKKIQEGWTDFDVAVAVPAMMKSVSRLGRILGPQGKMPSPKAGTVVDDIAPAVSEYAAGKVEFRNDDGGNIHAIVGKISFEVEKLVENIEAFVGHIKHLRPASAKGTYIRNACVSLTMSPSIRLDLAG